MIFNLTIFILKNIILNSGRVIYTDNCEDGGTMDKGQFTRIQLPNRVPTSSSISLDKVTIIIHIS